MSINPRALERIELDLAFPPPTGRGLLELD
jgi:hypothetical protein